MCRGYSTVYFELALIAYIIDRIFGEFSFIRHPVVLMGDYIKWFERHFYKDSILRGALLTLSLLIITLLITLTIEQLLQLFTLHSLLFTLLWGVIASTTIASHMLYESVKNIIIHPTDIKYLVSRDTEKLNNSDINKAAIETYAENLTDGVIAPLFYLLLFGVLGAFVYKAVNTLDSMIGYRNERYGNFGKFAARLDDAANYIPSRLPALLIAVLAGSKKAFICFYRYGRQHESPNAGHPIAAMALTLGIKLGGDTSYFGKIKSKPYFGEGRDQIDTEDIQKALALQLRLDIFIIILLGLGVML